VRVDSVQTYSRSLENDYRLRQPVLDRLTNARSASIIEQEILPSSYTVLDVQTTGVEREDLIVQIATMLVKDKQRHRREQRISRWNRCPDQVPLTWLGSAPEPDTLTP